jgi:hypothetical protein
MGPISRRALAAMPLGGCATPDAGGSRITLLDGTKGLENFDRVGEADWAAVDGAVQATKGGEDAAYLVSREGYLEFEMRVEFWASDDANSGIFMRCRNRAQITDESCYEANIFDPRPDQAFATGGMVKVAPVAQPAPRAGGRWNTIELIVRGSRLAVVLDGRTTVDATDSTFASGPIALQWGPARP